MKMFIFTVLKQKTCLTIPSYTITTSLTHCKLNSGVMVSVFTLSAADRRFGPRLGQTRLQNRFLLLLRFARNIKE